MNLPELFANVDWKMLSAVAQLIAFVVGSIWAIYKINEFRELKHLVQLDIDAKLYKLSTPITATAFTWDKEGNRREIPEQVHTHAVAVLLKFRNKGKTRLRIYNVQVAINTMRAPDEMIFSENDGQPKMKRIFTSGNVVPPMPVEGKSIDESSFYYIEPSVDQVIDFLALIPEPSDLLQVVGLFSLEQTRLFPQKRIGSKGLYPHTAASTYQIDSAKTCSIPE